MALPMAPPMIRPMPAAARGEVIRASQTTSADGGGEGEQDEGPAAKLAALREEPVAHALVPHEHQIEERGERHGALGADVINIEHPGLVHLVGEQRERGNPKTKRRQWSPDISHAAPYSAARLAGVELPDGFGVAGLSSGNSGSAPTSSRIFQERAHFVPWPARTPRRRLAHRRAGRRPSGPRLRSARCRW